MNCRDIEPLLLAERDSVLTPEQHAALATHVAACPACRQFRAHVGEAVTFLKTDAANVTVPDAVQEWRRLQVQLRGEATRSAKKRSLAPLIWFSAPLAAAAALAIAFFVSRPAAPPAAGVQVARQTVSDDNPAPTIAYVDKESGWLVVWATDSAAKTSG